MFNNFTFLYGVIVNAFPYSFAFSASAPAAVAVSSCFAHFVPNKRAAETFKSHFNLVGAISSCRRRIENGFPCRHIRVPAYYFHFSIFIDCLCLCQLYKCEWTTTKLAQWKTLLIRIAFTICVYFFSSSFLSNAHIAPETHKLVWYFFFFFFFGLSIWQFKVYLQYTDIFMVFP